LDKLIEILQREWTTLKAAPFAFLVAVVAATEFARRGWKWYYRKQIDDHDALIHLLQTQLKSREIDIEALQLNQAVDATYYRLIEDWAGKKARELEHRQ
jgi:hypothetical protein